jgi:hypothetical protein
MAVHGRYGKPCPVCGAPVQRIRYADIFLHWGLLNTELDRVLLHEMVHATGALGHGRAFRAELRRVAALGAPGAADELAYPDALKAMENAKRQERKERMRAWRAAGFPGMVRRRALSKRAFEEQKERTE